MDAFFEPFSSKNPIKPNFRGFGIKSGHFEAIWSDTQKGLEKTSIGPLFKPRYMGLSIIYKRRWICLYFSKKACFGLVVFYPEVFCAVWRVRDTHNKDTGVSALLRFEKVPTV